METNVNFVRKYRIIFLVMLMILVQLFQSCMKDDLEKDFFITDKRSGTGQISENTTVLFYGPSTFTIIKKELYRMVTLPDPTGYGNFTVSVQNGKGGNTRVNKPEIRVDGKMVISGDDFRGNVTLVTKKIPGLKNNSVLSVSLKGSERRFIIVSIEATPLFGVMKDVDGNSYKTVKIGNQEWMAENLRTTRFDDGTPIQNITGKEDWWNSVNYYILPAYCWYNNDILNKSTYGALYNTYAANSGYGWNMDRHLCPAGWHFPSSQEWFELIKFLDADAIENSTLPSEKAGGKLKEAGYLHWMYPNTGATNESGFTGLPGGYRFEDGSFMGLGSSGSWWGDHGFSVWGLRNNNTQVIFTETNNAHGFSVRCVKDR